MGHPVSNKRASVENKKSRAIIIGHPVSNKRASVCKNLKDLYIRKG